MSWLSDFFGGNKNVDFQTHTPEDYTTLKNLLYGVQEKGYPEIMGEEYWGAPWRQTGQDIRELFEAKKGLGAGTPEYTQMQNARSDLMSNLIGQNLGVRQNALNMLTNITPRQETIGFAPQQSGLQNLLSFAAPIASTALSGYIGGNVMKDILGNMGKSGTTTGIGNISNFYNPYQYDQTRDNPLLAQLMKFSGGY